MERHTAVFMLCLQSWLVFSTNTVSVPAFKEMKVPAESPSESTGKLLVKRLSPPISVSADMKSNADDLMTRNNAGDLMTRNDERENHSDDGDILSHIPETGSDAGKTSSIYVEKRHMRSLKPHQFKKTKNSAHRRKSHRRKSHRRRLRRDRDRSSTLSVANSLTSLTDLIIEYEKRQLEEQREELRRMLLEAEKHTGDNAASRTVTANPRDQDFLPYLRLLTKITMRLIKLSF